MSVIQKCDKCQHAAHGAGICSATGHGFGGMCACVAAMADQDSEAKSPLQLAEDRVGGFINGGGSCTQSTHVEATTLERLVMFKVLRIEFPHQSSTLTDLDIAIRKELKRGESKK